MILSITLRDVADILLISAVVLAVYVLYRRYRIKIKDRRKALATQHFSFVDFYYNAKGNYWQLLLELYKDEEINICPLDGNNQAIKSELKQYALKKGRVTINLESPGLKKASFVKIYSANKSFEKRMPR